jgi:branched-chain amino acid transport system permease protein
MPSHIAAPPQAAKRSALRRGAGDRVALRRWVSYAGYVLVIPVLLYLAPHIYNNQLLLLNLIVYLILAQGVNVIYGFTGYLPFGYVGFFGAGAYGTALAVMYAHSDGIVSVLLGGVASAAVALVLLPLLRLSGAYFALASLAASQALYLFIANPSLAGVTKGPYGVQLAAIFAPNQAYFWSAVLLAVSIAAVLYLRDSAFGLSLRAVRADPLSAAEAGVNVARARGIAWLVSAVLAGLAGGIFAWVTSVFYPQTVFSMSISVFAIVFALFGGVGDVLGPLLGGIALYSLYAYIGVSSPQYFQLVYGLLIVFLVLFLPGGLAGLVQDVRRRRAERNAGGRLTETGGPRHGD